MQTGSIPSRIESAPSRPTVAKLVGLWIVGGLALLIALGRPAVQRTQEARVLETARQMASGETLRDWMIPVLNGQPRLQKPPLAYWMAAGSYKLFGVSEWAGRLPTAVTGWLMVGVMFWVGQWLLGWRGGMLAAVALLGSFMFVRLNRLAETDAPAALGVTLGVFGFWRAIESSGGGKRWFHLGAAGMALAVMSKGGPGLFPAVFFAVWMLISRRWDAIGRLLRSGAWATLAGLALPWFIYVAATMGVGVFSREVRDVITGEDHGSWFYGYFPSMVVGVAPWCALVPLAVWEGGWRWRRDARIRGVLVWAAAVFGPLCLAGNKQAHYLLPLMPPLILALAWLVEVVMSGDASPLLERTVRVLLSGTFLTFLAIAPVMVIVPWMMYRGIHAVDVALMLGGMSAGGAWWVYRRRGIFAGVLAGSWVWVWLLPFALGLWLPALNPADMRVIAARIQQQAGAGPYCFYGGEVSFPLCFTMRQTIPYMASTVDLNRAVASAPGLTVLVPMEKAKAPVLPAGWVFVGEAGEAKDHHFRLYQFRP